MPPDLFSGADTLTAIPLADGELQFLERLSLGMPTQEVFARLLQEIAWREERIMVWGKLHRQPRLSAWYGDPGACYTYSGKLFAPNPWTPLLATIRSAVEQATACRFNSVLLNHYRDQFDSMGFHSDDEAELGPQPAIASLSLGATRTFILKHKTRKELKPVRLDLGDGNLLLMAGGTQTNWRHGINKESRACGPRINLTFRLILTG